MVEKRSLYKLNQSRIANYMKVIIVLLLLNITLGLDVIRSSCSSETCLSNLKTYVEESKGHIMCGKDKGRLVCKTPLHKHSVEEISGLSIVAYAVDQITGEKHPIQDVYREDNDENIFLVVSLTVEEIKNSKGCKRIKDETDRFKRQCEIVWEYIGTPSTSSLMKQTYTLAIEATSKREIIIEFEIEVVPILEEACSCEINLNAPYSIRGEIYLGTNCDKPFNRLLPLTYGDYICLGIFGEDPISKTEYLQIDGIVATYTNSEGLTRPDPISSIVTKKCSLSGSCEPGKTYAIFPIIYVGTVELNVAVTFLDTYRLLTNTNSKKGILSSFEEIIIVKESDFGSAIGVSLLTLIVMIAFII